MADQTIFKSDDIVIDGNLTVKGTSEVIKTTATDLQIVDKLITLNKGGTLGGDTSGIEIESGGSITATIGYTTASGWDFGNKNITTSGTIAGSLNLAVDSINDTHIDFGTGANQVSTFDVPEQTNLYYTQARFNSAFTAKSTTDATGTDWDSAESTESTAITAESTDAATAKFSYNSTTTTGFS